MIIGCKYKNSHSNQPNIIYYGFSDDLKSKDKLDCIWHKSMIQFETFKYGTGKCIITNKNKYDATLCFIDSYHRQFKMSQILNDNQTHILNRFHMDCHTVTQIFPQTLYFCVFYCFLCDY